MKKSQLVIILIVALILLAGITGLILVFWRNNTPQPANNTNTSTTTSLNPTNSVTVPTTELPTVNREGSLIYKSKTIPLTLLDSEYAKQNASVKLALITDSTLFGYVTVKEALAGYLVRVDLDQELVTWSTMVDLEHRAPTKLELKDNNVLLVTFQTIAGKQVQTEYDVSLEE